MTEDSRQHALDALGIRRWVRRGADETVHEAEAVLSSTATAPAGRAEPEIVQRTAVKASAPGTPPTPAPDASPQPREDHWQPPVDWDTLRAAVAECRRCGLCQTRHHAVFGIGPRNAPLMVIGEGPGAEEDKQGEPFVGRAGKLLDQMLKAIGHSRNDNVFIANVVKCRPPANRDPRPDEVAACRPYLDRQIELIKPRLIVGLGRVAAHRLLDTQLPMSKLRGSLHHYGAQATPVMLTYHPAYLLRSPREKAKAWEDLKAIAGFLAKTLPPELDTAAS